jgi:hypothetical protein
MGILSALPVIGKAVPGVQLCVECQQNLDDGRYEIQP